MAQDFGAQPGDLNPLGYRDSVGRTDQERELLAAKLVGRWCSGAPLTLAPDHDDPALGADPLRNNDFTYAADPDGRHVPLGSHMRRLNPEIPTWRSS